MIIDDNVTELLPLSVLSAPVGRANLLFLVWQEKLITRSQSPGDTVYKTHDNNAGLSPP